MREFWRFGVTYPRDTMQQGFSKRIEGLNLKQKKIILSVISGVYFSLSSALALAQSFPALSPAPVAGSAPITIIPPPAFDDFGYYKKYTKKPKGCLNEVKQGFEAYDKQDCEKTIAFLKDSIKGGCDDPLVLFKLAACSEFTGSIYSAAQYYKEAEEPLKILPSPHRYQKDFYEAYGRTLLMNKKTEEALNYLSKAAEHGSPSFTLFYLLGELYNIKKQPEMALQFYQKALTQALEGAAPSQLAKVYGTIGKTFLEVKDWQKAIEYIDIALKNSPNDPALQQARYKAQELKRQEEMFKMMQGISGGGQNLPPFQPQMPKP